MSFYLSPNGKEITVEKELFQDEYGKYYLCSKNSFVIRCLNNIDEEIEKKINKLIGIGASIEGVCFPAKKIYDETGNLVGYMMRKPKGKKFSSLISPDGLKKWHPEWTRIELTKVAISLLQILKNLRDYDILLGDINTNNIFISNENEVYLVGTEFFQIRKIPYTTQKTDFYIPQLMSVGSLRGKTAEDFAIASLVFEILLPGRHPFYTSFDSIQNNVESKKFNYPLGENEELVEVDEKWVAVWFSLPQEMRFLFYNTFKENQAPPLNSWVETILPGFLRMLEDNVCSSKIFPTNSDLLLSNKSRNMNLRDVNESNENLRRIETVLSDSEDSDKIGVLELSTKAVKLLIGRDPSRIRTEPFGFQMFYREAQKTNTGRGLNSKNIMDMSYFRNNVLPAIKKYKRTAIEQGVDKLYTVATAAYRTANNRDEIIDLIRRETGINVRILTKSEEATATIKAFRHTTSQKDLLEQFEYTMIIDQGGGSTEVSVFKNWKEIKSYSINLGTEVLRTLLFQESTSETELRHALSNTDRLIKERLRTFYKNMLEYLPKDEPIFCVAVGTAITSATGEKKNAQQHDTRMPIRRIQGVIDDLDSRLKSQYTYVRQLHNDLNDYGRNVDKLDREVVQRVGLPMFIDILTALKMDAVYVSGTGLWYGIYFQQLFQDFDEIGTDALTVKTNEDNPDEEDRSVFVDEGNKAEKSIIDFEDQSSTILESKGCSNIFQVARIIISNYGDSIISEKRFVNLLEDLLAFGNNPELKSLIIKFIEGGYSDQILQLSDKKSGNIDTISRQFSNRMNVNKDDSLRIGRILAYGLNY